MQESFKLLGLNIRNETFADAITEVGECIGSRRKRIYFPINVDMIVKCRKDTEFGSILKSNSDLLPDGMPIIWAAKFLGNSIKEKLSGSDLFPALCKFAAEKGYKVFFLGAEPSVAEKAADMLKTKYASLKIAGIYSPAHGFEKIEAENQKIVNMINASEADILFIGLGAPKQEKWIWEHKNLVNVPITLCVGASFDFVAGKVKRAPKWMRQSGFEWLWRLVMEPRRLWKRYLVDDMQFFWLVLKERMRR